MRGLIWWWYLREPGERFLIKAFAVIAAYIAVRYLILVMLPDIDEIISALWMGATALAVLCIYGTILVRKILCANR